MSEPTAGAVVAALAILAFALVSFMIEWWSHRAIQHRMKALDAKISRLERAVRDQE